jgi:RHS repeat-associated protein
LGEDVYWYGLDRNVLDQTDETGSITNSAFNEYIYVNGVRYARRDYQKNAYYYFDDQIGSARSMAYVPAGTRTATLCYEGDFYPYGAESIVTNTCPQNFKWTGKERDAETGNDNFDARYYSSVYGRFLSADWSAVPAAVPYANLTNPQTLNLYAIVSDNPETYADLNGHMAFFGEVWTGSATGNPSTTANDVTFQERQEPKEEAEEKPETKEREEAEWNRAGEALNRTNMEADVRVTDDMRRTGYDEMDTGICHAPDPTPKMQSNKPFERTPENQERMAEGRAPTGKDGKPVELHHEGQTHEGPSREMTRNEHREGDNFKRNHPNTGQQPSKIDRNRAARERREHWTKRSKDDD